jgi:hypothetical protein
MLLLNDPDLPPVRYRFKMRDYATDSEWKLIEEWRAHPDALLIERMMAAKTLVEARWNADRHIRETGPGLPSMFLAGVTMLAALVVPVWYAAAGMSGGGQALVGIVGGFVLAAIIALPGLLQREEWLAARRAHELPDIMKETNDDE